MRIALLSNITVESIASKYRSETGDDVFVPRGYNTWMQELVTPESEMYAFAPTLVFVLLDGQELVPDAWSEEEALHAIDSTLDILTAAAETHQGMTFVVSTLDIPRRSLAPLASPRIEETLRSRWREGLDRAALPALDLSEIVATLGRSQCYSPKMWYLGGLRFSQQGERAIVRELRRIRNALAGPRKKLLALDLDNTLWGGVVGEDGMGGLDLAPTGSGARYYDFQKRVRDLRNMGVLLAVVSKNTAQDALDAIRTHPYMLLREDDFVSLMINWQPKPENLRQIAATLNIGLDSFVFIDDSPIEREAVRTALPEVAVPDFPSDTSTLESFISDMSRDFFLLPRATDEDADKTEMYRAEAKREGEKTNFGTLEDFLASLDMELTLSPLSARDIPRAAQLTQKTNQFNTTTRRYTEADLARMSADPSWFIRIGSLRDRFGDLGQILLLIARIEGEKATIDTFLMSCRAMGRGVENAAVAEIESELEENGVDRIEAIYIPTPKNSPVADLWPRMGYVPVSGSGDGRRYVRDLRETVDESGADVRRPTSIRILRS
jgi:FkbH-like protein